MVDLVGAIHTPGGPCRNDDARNIQMRGVDERDAELDGPPGHRLSLLAGVARA
ncbi:hypothetical protein [Actinoplanes subglobosus]|uniref:Uncharacterized protein n=1 Tax=Actinoplanes subglobosus TaxID=1547892 RepID=A0ABV8J1D7_9ACTN